MKDKLFYGFDYVVGNDFIFKNEIKVKVIFIYKDARIITLPLMLKKIKGANETYYLNEAKKTVNKMIENGSLQKYCDNYIRRKKSRYALSALICLLVLACIGTALYFVYKDKPTPTAYHVSMVTDGVTISPTSFRSTDEKYVGTINVTATSKMLDGAPLITLEKSGKSITTYTYDPAEDNKSAELTIEKQYITDNIKVKVTLVDVPIYHISMRTAGTDIEEKEFPIDQDYVGTISVTNENKILAGLNSVVLDDGKFTPITSSCTYTRLDDKTASLEIPKTYLTNDILVSVNLDNIDQRRKEELTFTCVEAGSLGIHYHSYCTEEAVTPTEDVDVSYKIDGGDWIDFDISHHFEPGVDDGYSHEYMFPVALTAGQVVQVRGNNDRWSFQDYEDGFCEVYLTFVAENGGKFEVSNNVMSLLSSDNFVALSDASDYGFANLFGITVAPGDTHRGANISDASNLYLPTNLADSCFDSMFIDNINLTKAPDLPATTLADSCYYYMFNGCSSLIEAPELPAESLTYYCYNNMFSNCTALVNAPEIKATELADDCCEEMFMGCTSLQTAPKLPATPLADYCYNSMFKGCTDLVVMVGTATDYLIFDCPEIIPEESVTDMFEGVQGAVPTTPTPGTKYYLVPR